MSDVARLIEVLAEGYAAFDGREVTGGDYALARHTLGWLMTENYRVIRENST